jgi:hypothetical protein
MTIEIGEKIPTQAIASLVGVPPNYFNIFNISLLKSL